MEATGTPSSIHPKPKFPTVKKIAEFLNVSESLVCKLCKTQKLRHLRFGHATPVGSGTVARTKRIPVEQRAEAAVIARMRHQTTGHDSMPTP